MKFYPKIFRNITQRISQVLIIMIAFVISYSSYGSQEITADFDDISTLKSVSTGLKKKDLSDDVKIQIIQQQQLERPDQLSGKATGKTRAQLIAKKIPPLYKPTKHHVRNHNVYADFAIYSASSTLEDDFDEDGFYQTVSISFDADVYSYSNDNIAQVYALLYVSKNGGPWTHYYTTDSFLIEGDTDLDEYEVISSFQSGYESDYYDVLIDLYQVGYDDIVASYSSDDDNALYALPIESAEFDHPYIEVVEVNGGPFSIAILILLLTTLYIRRINPPCRTASNEHK